MHTSEHVAEIAAALLKAQKAITFASKDATNPHFKSKYADLPAVIDAIKSALNDNGIVYLQTPTKSDQGYVTLTTRLMHESGQFIEDTASVPLSKNDAQGYGSGLTYLRRYSLAAITGLYQDDDDGNAASAKPDKKTPPLSPKATPKAIGESEMADVLLAMRESPDLDILKGIFGGAYTRGSEQQKSELQKQYNELKAQFTQGAKQ